MPPSQQGKNMRKFIKRAALFASSAVMAVPAMVVSGGAAHATGFTSIRVNGSTHCLDNATENADKIQMWNCTGGAEQKWFPEFNASTNSFSIVNQSTGSCVTTPYPNGPGPLVMLFCLGSTSQQWNIIFTSVPHGQTSGGYSVWQNVESGLCLSTDSVANGTVPRTWPCDVGAQYEQWHFDN